jgi:hypothetical protein
MPIIRNLRKDLNEGRMDNLRSISYEETGTKSPFVTKDILSPPEDRKGLFLEASARLDDLTRIGKMFVNKPGLQYLAHEALLNQKSIIKKSRKKGGSLVGGIIRTGQGNLAHLAQVVGSTLAQVPVNGTGTHFIRKGLDNDDVDSYLQLGRPTGANYVLNGEAIPVGTETETGSILPKRNTTPSPGDLGKNHIGISGTLSSPTDISFYTNNNPYYNSTENNVIGVTRAGGFITRGADPDTLNAINSSTSVQTTAGQFSLGIDKSTDTNTAVNSSGLSIKVNGQLKRNKFNPLTNDAEDFLTYTQTSTDSNIALVSAGKPIKNPRLILEGGIVAPQTTAKPGDLGIPSSTVLNDGNIIADFNGGGLTSSKYNSNNTYTGFTTLNNINAIQSGISFSEDGYIPTSNQTKHLIGIVDGKSSINLGLQDDRVFKGSYDGTVASKTKPLFDFRAQGQNKNKQGDPIIDEPFNDKGVSFTGRAVNSYSFDYNKNTIKKETRVGLGDPGSRKNRRVNYNTPGTGTQDLLNKIDVKTVSLNEYSEGIRPINGAKLPDGKTGTRDLIQLEFQIITPDQVHFLPFRAFLDTFDDSFNADWNSFKYLGRADSFYTYNGFERTINIGFKIAAQSAQEMKPLYRKAATLASVTAPTYGVGGRFMRGNIAKVTVGDYIYQQPGIIESVQYTWQTDYPWEISFSNPEGNERGQILPHVLDVQLSFKVIHDFLPTTGVTPFISNHSPTGNKDTYVKLKDPEIVIVKTEAQQAAEDINEEAAEEANNGGEDFIGPLPADQATANQASSDLSPVFNFGNSILDQAPPVDTAGDLARLQQQFILNQQNPEF